MAGGWMVNLLSGKNNEMIKHLRSIFSLVRFPNLLIIAATQYAMRYLIMEPLLPIQTFSFNLGIFSFSCWYFPPSLLPRQDISSMIILIHGPI